MKRLSLDCSFIHSQIDPPPSQLRILGLRIQRMPTEPGQEFNNPASYPYTCVASPSCHDVSPTRAWWVALGWGGGMFGAERDQRGEGG